MTITAAADGSSLGNPGPAGWAWYVDEDTWDAGGWPQGTNNLGELTAILRLLQATAETGEELHILADSQYAINVVSKWRLGWKKRGWTKADKKPIKNLELIQEIDRAMEGRRVTFEWVKGHAGHRMNERADDLARGCAEAYQAGRTPEPGPGFGGGARRSRGSADRAHGGAAAASVTAEPHDAVRIGRRRIRRRRIRRPGVLPLCPRPSRRTMLWSPARAHLPNSNTPRPTGPPLCPHARANMRRNPQLRRHLRPLRAAPLPTRPPPTEP